MCEKVSYFSHMFLLIYAEDGGVNYWNVCSKEYTIYLTISVSISYYIIVRFYKINAEMLDFI